MTNRPHVHHRFDLPAGSILECEPGSSMTKQQYRDECDINVLLARYQVSGTQVSGNPMDPVYGDFTEAVDFHEAQNILIRSREQFAGLSSRVRERFNNDPEKFLEFVNDPKNVDEAYELGMLNDEAAARLKAKREAAKPPPEPAPAPKPHKDPKPKAPPTAG